MDGLELRFKIFIRFGVNHATVAVIFLHAWALLPDGLGFKTANELIDLAFDLLLLR